MAVSAIANNSFYQDFKWVQIGPISDEAHLQLSKLDPSKTDKKKILIDHGVKETDIIVSPDLIQKLDGILNALNIEYTIAHQDVSELIKKSGTFTNKKIYPLSTRGRMRSEHKLELDQWNSHQNINTWLDNLAVAQDDVQSLSLGKSYEGRIQKLIRIIEAGDGKPNIYIQCGAHAREWTSVSTCVYLIDQLVNGDSTEVKKFRQNLNFHILPVFNPDGYEFTFSDDRFWRKTRSKTSEPDCLGVDPNRNWGFKWGVAGSTQDPCDYQTYMGPNPFSEVELINVRDYLQELSPVPILALPIHSDAQSMLTPYGYAHPPVYPPNNDEIVELSKEMVEAMTKVNGVSYIQQNSAEFYPASGASDDWFMGVLGARFSGTLELRQGKLGPFEDLRENIIPTGNETWAGLKVMLRKMIELS